MFKEEIIAKTMQYAKDTLGGEGSGHDWWHIERVWNNAKHIAEKEGITDTYVIELAALLHDIADWKFHNGDEEAGPRTARTWLESLEVEEENIDHVTDIIRKLSFKGAQVTTTMPTKEGMIVQDADRLDAIGAIGIARTFTYGGHKGREMYNPNIPPVMHNSFEAYKSNQSHTLNHFYEKLFLLKERMNTEAAKHIAEQRHHYMETFVQQFLSEWEGKA